MAVRQFKSHHFKQGRSLCETRVFELEQAMTSALGPISLEIQVEPPHIIEAGHLCLINSLFEHFCAYELQVGVRLYQSYCAADDAWLRRVGVPAGLSRDGILPYINGLRLVVALPLDEEDEEYLRFCARPDWDLEHGFYLAPDVEDVWLVEAY